MPAGPLFGGAASDKPILSSLSGIGSAPFSRGTVRLRVYSSLQHHETKALPPSGRGVDLRPGGRRFSKTLLIGFPSHAEAEPRPFALPLGLCNSLGNRHLSRWEAGGWGEVRVSGRESLLASLLAGGWDVAAALVVHWSGSSMGWDLA